METRYTDYAQELGLSEAGFTSSQNHSGSYTFYTFRNPLSYILDVIRMTPIVNSDTIKVEANYNPGIMDWRLFTGDDIKGDLLLYLVSKGNIQAIKVLNKHKRKQKIDNLLQ